MAEFNGLIQKAKNASVYPASPLTIALEKAVTADNVLIIVVEGSKFLDPNTVALMAGVETVTSHPVVKYNNVALTPLAELVNFEGDLYAWSSLFIFAAATVVGKNEVVVTNADGNGRPTYNNGLCAQVFEFSGFALPAGDNTAFVVNPLTEVEPLEITATAGGLVFAAAISKKCSGLKSNAVVEDFVLADQGHMFGTANYYAAQYMISDAGADMDVTFTAPDAMTYGVAAIALPAVVIG